jgi:hypothetical protein
VSKKPTGAELVARMRALREEAQDLRDEVLALCRSAKPLEEADQLQRLSVVSGCALQELSVGLYGTIDVNRSAAALRGVSQ